MDLELENNQKRMADIPHYMIDIVSPKIKPFQQANIKISREKIKEIIKEGKLQLSVAAQILYRCSHQFCFFS
jgi:hypothetical protein